jgi:hypothetical protein
VKNKMVPTDPIKESFVFLIGFNVQRIREIMADQTISKLVIFDDDENSRRQYEKLYPLFKDRITLYEGDVKSSFSGYFRLREKENILEKINRVEILGSHFQEVIVIN